MIEGTCYLPKNRYLELKYFCRQYNYWKYLISCPDKCPTNISLDEAKNAVCMIEKAAYDTDCDFIPMLLHKVTRGGSYDKLAELYSEMAEISKEDFIEAYKKFFYFLSQEKGI